jgi:hypothetical protein
MAITLAQAQAQLDAWLAASLDVARNQSYRMADGRMLTRADAAEITKHIDYWTRAVSRLTAGRRGARTRTIALG